MQHDAPRIALVTGATQGLGLGLVRGLSTRLGPEDLVLLTSRDPQRVAAAVAAGFPGPARVEGRTLDVTDPDAVSRMADDIEREHGGVDIVLSNATARLVPGVAAADQIDLQVATSNLATSHVLRAWLPILRPGGSLLVVASSLGRLGHLAPDVRARVEQATTLDDVDRVVEDWRQEVRAGVAVERGWPGWINIPSKVAQVAAVRAACASRRDRDLAEGRLVASVCPGLVDTGASRPWFPDMSRAQTPDAAAAPVLDFALGRPLDPDTYGQLVRFGRVLPWHGAVDPLPAALAAG